MACQHPSRSAPLSPTSRRVGVFSLAMAALLACSPARPARAGDDVPSFRQDVIPILTKAGCNSGGCHGKLAGQNGFKLSLRGYAPEWDFEALVKELGGRRVDFAAPASSLLLEKAAGRVAHEGGKRFDEQSAHYKTLLAWIEHRGPGPLAEDTDPERIELTPAAQVMQPGGQAQLTAIAHYPGGRTRDVTWLAQFVSNDAGTVTADEQGRVTSVRHGEATVRAHFQNLVAAVTITAPFDCSVDPAMYARQVNVVDQHVFAKLASLRIPPSGDADDATFVRRAYLDAIGMLPTPDGVRAFLSDARPDKRARLVDDLLARPEWADYWALQIGDLLQNRKERDHDVRGAKGVRVLHGWLRQQLAANRPWNELAREILTVTGNESQHPAVGYFVVTVGERREVEQSEVADSVAQAFLGTRIGCARCHNHPLERYTQDDYYHFAAFFSRVALDRKGPTEGMTTLAAAGRDEADRLRELAQTRKDLEEAKLAVAGKSGDELSQATARVMEREARIEQLQKDVAEARLRMPTVNQPRTGKPMAPQPLDRSAPQIEPGADPRLALADWMVDPKNEAFSGAMVNRLWRHFMGMGLVEPVDDLRSSNPPSNPALWDALRAEFVGHNYDLKHVQRLILNSRAYQLDSATLPENETDARFYSHYMTRRLPAEVMLDAIASATGVPDEFPGYPVGLRATQLPEPGVGSYFLTLFGRSDRVTACACERQGDVTLPQLLHLINGEAVTNKIRAADGRLATLLAREADDAKVLDEVFLATLGRLPTDVQRQTIGAALKAGDPRDAVFQDLMWALLNSNDFAFNR